ncbi:tape measure protein [uncultured Acidaminococcus sp.]|uniref:tape measure protein n=1 Tax=uncultured Acidaminococcus sp. TaxID=352152 RepID=UPI00259024D5|nr:tape measure protein [uncultured Acidaminococcus sp.]
MATIADLLVKIGADTSDLRKELNATKRQIKTAFGSDALDLSKKSLAVLGGIGAGLAALGVASVKAGASLQSTKTAFTNMLGSAEKAQDFLAKMQDFAAKTPFEFSQVSQAAQKFIAFGFSAEQVIPTLTAVGDAAAGVGLGAEGINRITLALGQMAAKSKVQAGEMMQLTETGIPAWKMLADQIGVSVPEAMSMVSKGAIDAATGITALVSGMEARPSAAPGPPSWTGWNSPRPR